MSVPLLDSRPATPPVASRAGWIVFLLFLANLLNFYDRQLPAILLEQIKAEFHLDDAQVGVLASAFVLVGALAGVPLGLLADRVARKWVIGVGLIVWSIFTALGGVLLSFGGFLGTRIGVGIGEAAYSPASGSLVADLYPMERRGRATAIYTLGYPVGLLLAFFTVGGIATAFGSWRAPFLVAAVPGLIVAILFLLIKEPQRGQADFDAIRDVTPDRNAVELKRRAVLKVPSLWGMVLAFAGFNFAAYALGTFLTPVLQRYYGLSLIPAAIISGIVIAIPGLLGLLFAGRVLDRAARSSAARRIIVAAIALAIAAVFSLIGLAATSQTLWQLIVFLGLGYLFGIVYLAAYIPAITDVINPKRRSTAIGLMLAIAILLGGAGGPIAVGALSDSLRMSAPAATSAALAAADGLRVAMLILVPVGYALAALGMFLASLTANRDRARMLAVEAQR